MTLRSDILVVGAGFLGLATAWALSEREPGLKIRVLDAGEFACGGAGRNGSGFRLQWSRDFNIRLVQDSLKVFAECEALLDYPDGVELNHQGYMILAHSETAYRTLMAGVQQQRAMGVPSEILSPEDCVRMQPGLNPAGLHGASFCPLDGTASPFRWLDALYRRCQRNGVEVRFRSKVLRLTEEGGGFAAHTAGGAYAADRLVLCTDWAAPELLEPLGVSLPIGRAAKEAMITEASAPLLRTVLMAGAFGLGIKQLGRGNIIITLSRGAGEDDQVLQLPKGWLADCAGRAATLLPALGSLNVMRQWSGWICKTPDMQPILGETERPGLFVAASAYKGFMISPQAGRIMADLILDGHSNHMAAASLGPDRFARDALVPETLTI